MGKRYDQITLVSNHPLVAIAGRRSVPLSRAVLWDQIGPGPHVCHWCGCRLRWGKGTGRGILLADHLDGDIYNNDATNLVPACQPCNVQRGHGNPDTCKRGHPKTPENVYVSPTGAKNCRPCAVERQRERPRLVRWKAPS